MKTILVDAWNTFVTESGVFKEMQELLDSFENKKIILTNANEEQKETLGITNMPYQVFSLSHSPDKTDPNYFRMFLEKFSLTPKDVIYFEHNEDAFNSARSVGIKTYHYDKTSRDLISLKKFIEENL